MKPHEHMRYYREQRGISQGQLFRMSGVAQCQISKYERGLLNPSLTTLIALCTALRCTINDYVGVDYGETS